MSWKSPVSVWWCADGKQKKDEQERTRDASGFQPKGQSTNLDILLYSDFQKDPADAQHLHKGAEEVYFFLSLFGSCVITQKLLWLYLGLNSVVHLCKTPNTHTIDRHTGKVSTSLI